MSSKQSDPSAAKKSKKAKSEAVVEVVAPVEEVVAAQAQATAPEVQPEVVVETPVVQPDAVPQDIVQASPAAPAEVAETAAVEVPAESLVADSVKGKKQRKPKLVRDSFTIPESDYARFAELKQRCLEQGIAIKKSELLRLGLAVLANLPADELGRLAQDIEKLKTGRPSKDNA